MWNWWKMWNQKGLQGLKALMLKEYHWNSSLENLSWMLIITKKSWMELGYDSWETLLHRTTWPCKLRKIKTLPKKPICYRPQNCFSVWSKHPIHRLTESLGQYNHCFLAPIRCVVSSEPEKHHTAAQHCGESLPEVLVYNAAKVLFNLGSPLPHFGHTSACLRLFTSFLF